MNRNSCTAMLLVAVTFCIAACATPGGDGDWTTLLDGATPDTLEQNWYRAGEQANWRIVDGAVQADRGGKTSSYLVSKESYRDFQVRAEFWADTTTNSGVFIRVSDPKNINPKTGYEININDQSATPGSGTGGIPKFAKADPGLKAGGRWNTYVITAKGASVTVEFNGAQTLSMSDSTFASGPLALQFGGAKSGMIRFRKVEVRPL